MGRRGLCKMFLNSRTPTGYNIFGGAYNHAHCKIENIQYFLKNIRHTFSSIPRNVNIVKKNKCVTNNELPLNIPSKERFFQATLCSLLNHSPTRRKRIQYSGRTYQIPRLVLMKGDANPLIKTTKQVHLIHPLTLSIVCHLKPKGMGMRQKKRQLSLSKAFHRSTLATVAL